MLGAEHTTQALGSVSVRCTDVANSSARTHDLTHDATVIVVRVGARGHAVHGPAPTVPDNPIKRAARGLFPDRSMRSLTDEEFWECVRIARAWLQRAGVWARTQCRKGHELHGDKLCNVCERERDARYRAEAIARNAGRPPRKERERRQRQRRSEAA